MKTTISLWVMLLCVHIASQAQPDSSNLYGNQKVVLLTDGAIQSKLLCESPQETNSQIKVKGMAEETVSPDMISFFIQISVIEKQTAKGVQKLNDATAALQQKLVAAGFSQKELKLINFSIQPVISYRDGKEDFEGYAISHAISITMETKRDRMEKLIHVVSDENSERISLSFHAFLSAGKMREVEKKLIKTAIAQARENADIIAEAAQMSIARVLQVNYGTNEPTTYPALAETAMAKMNTPVNANKNYTLQGISLHDISIYKEVTIIYEAAKPAK